MASNLIEAMSKCIGDNAIDGQKMNALANSDTGIDTLEAMMQSYITVDKNLLRAFIKLMLGRWKRNSEKFSHRNNLPSK